MHLNIKTFQSCLQFLHKEEKGSVASEYLLLIALFWFPMLSLFFLPGTATSGHYGLLGNMVVNRFQLMLYMVTLPFP